MGASWKYFVSILCLIFSYGIDSVKADTCYDDDGHLEMICPDSISDYDETYCCGSSGNYYCCDYDDYELYTEAVSSAIIAVIVVSVLIVVGIVGGCIACCVCGCLCCAKPNRPVTRTFVTTQQAPQSQVVIQQPYLPPQGGYVQF